MVYEQGTADQKNEQDPFKKIWLASESLSSRRSDPTSPRSLGWMMGSMALILILVIIIVAYMAVDRSELGMSKLLAEKGASLLKVFESALKTSMRSDGRLQLQELLEEISQNEDIEFIAVTMDDGLIIAHSDRTRLSDIFNIDGHEITLEELAALDPVDEEKSRMVTAEGKRVFLIYRHFTLGHSDWDENVPEPTIFLGLDVSPFEITRNQNRIYMAILSFVILFIGLTGLLTLSFAQRAAESRYSQQHAENRVQALENEMRVKDKLVAVGTLAAGIAHEIRNPLSSIKGYATYFKNHFPEGSDDREAATVMVSEVERLNKVISNLLGLSKPGDVDLKPVEIRYAAQHVLRLLRQNASKNHVELNLRIAPKVPKINADIEKLSQAILNLCLNAMDAMPNGGKLTIAVSGGKKRICIMVKDNGSGIPPALIRQIFDPYFTTKGSGTGLGLPMCHKIILAHRGKLNVYSRPASDTSPGCTIFHIWLPV